MATAEQTLTEAYELALRLAPISPLPGENDWSTYFREYGIRFEGLQRGAEWGRQDLPEMWHEALWFADRPAWMRNNRIPKDQRNWYEAIGVDIDELTRAMQKLKTA